MPMTMETPPSRDASADPDVRLMLAFKRGEQAAFEELLHLHFRGVLNFVYRFVGRREIAEELTHEVFIKVYRGAGSYEPRARFRTWLYTIAKHLCLNELRRRSHDELSLEAMESTPAERGRAALPDPIPPAEEGLIRRERIAAVRAAIDELPENQRLAVILRRYEELSYEEIAAALETSEKAVKSLLSRAKEHLRQKLAPWMEK
jgi:RNA polymerase sigma-70 factor (ECF subfamily)